jgi:Zn-dependent M28 family amino/carboxypeptidase
MLFAGNMLTNPGGGTNMFAAGARRGPPAALIVHDDAGASYGWDVVRNSWSGAQYDLPAADDPEPRIPVQGWLTADAARQLFAGAGLDLDDAYGKAGKPGFKPVPLNATLSIELASTTVDKTSRNVVGVLPGKARADEAVLYMAHWDHLGKHKGEQGDAIYNGAVDNATGVAGILEIAEAFAHQEQAPERSVVFAAVTLEESGLLGSKYYVAHPTFPLEKIAGVVNLDAMSVAGRSHDLVITGKGNSELEDMLKIYADQQGRVLNPEGNTAAGYYFRSDHFNFAKAGVPALYAKGGNDLVEGGAAAGKAAAAEYAKRYHQPSDEVHDGWHYEGIVEDLAALYGVGRDLAAGDRWPNWYEGNPFKAARDRMMADKQSGDATK